MRRLFSMSDLGLLGYYLRVEVNQEDSHIMITQAAYNTKMLKRAGMKDYHVVHAPMEARLKLGKDSSEKAVDATLYHNIIGSLRYLIYTRLDITFVVGYLGRSMEASASNNLTVVKHLLRYIAGTLTHGCVCRRGNDESLVIYSDLGHAGDVDSRKSTSGILSSGAVPSAGN